MMGQAASSLDIPITKGVSGLVAFDEGLAERADQTVDPVHPVRLLPGGLSDVPESVGDSDCWRATRSTNGWPPRST
jgi:Na+-translocating ferredoxin:NAD+ oxidoreductase RnfC subunit